MTTTKKPFEDYLRDVHAEQYKGLDDEMADDFDSWITDLDNEELIEYAEKLISSLTTNPKPK